MKGRRGGRVADQVPQQCPVHGVRDQEEEPGDGDERDPAHQGEAAEDEDDDQGAAEQGPCPQRRAAESARQALREEGVLDAEPAGRRDRDDQAGQRRAVAAEPGPAGQ